MMDKVFLVLFVLVASSPQVYDYDINDEDLNASLSRIRRQIEQEPPLQPILNPPIPTSIGHYIGADQQIDSCVRDEVLVNGACHRLLTQGPCAKDEYVVLDPANQKGFCAPRLCAPDRIFVFSDQMCHDPRNTGLCPPGRHLYQTAYGTPVCQCPDGTYEGDDDLDDDVCDPILGQTLSCPPNQVLWFRNFKMPPECMPDPCGGENLNRGPNDLPFIPSATDGKCYQLGQKPGFCPAQTWYSLALETLSGVCEDLEDAGYQIFDDETLAFLTQMYGDPIPRDATAPLPPGGTQTDPGQTRGTFPGHGVVGPPGVPGQPGLGGQVFASQAGTPGQDATTTLVGTGTPGVGFSGRPGVTGQGFSGQQPGVSSTGQGFRGQKGTSTTGVSQSGTSEQQFRGQPGTAGLGFTTTFGQSETPGAGAGQGLGRQPGTSTGGQPTNGQGFVPQAFPGQIFPGQIFPGQLSFPGQTFPGQAFPGQAFPGQAFPGQVFPGQTYPGQLIFPAQTFPGQTFPGQTFPGQTFPTQGFTVHGSFGQKITNTTMQGSHGPSGTTSGQGFTGQKTTSGIPGQTFQSGTKTTTGHPGTTTGGHTMTTMFGTTTTPPQQPPGSPRGGSHRGHPAHITSRGRPQQQASPSPPTHPQSFPQGPSTSTNTFQGFRHSPQSHQTFHKTQLAQASPVLSPRITSNQHPIVFPQGTYIPGHPGFFISNEAQSFEMFGMGGMGNQHHLGGRSFSSQPSFSNQMSQPDLSVVMGHLVAQRRGMSSSNSDLSFLQTHRSHPDHGFFNGVKTLMAGVLENPSFTQQQQQQQQQQHHHRSRRSALPHSSPGNVFETRLVGCRAGAVRDINAKCRNTILPSGPPIKRNNRAVPPVPPRPGCPTGQAYDRTRTCASVNNAINSINAYNLG